MVKFKGKCGAIEQHEPFKELKGPSFFRTVGRRTDGRAGTHSRRWLGLTHGRTVPRWTFGHGEGRVSGRRGGQTCVIVGRSGGRTLVSRSIEQIRVAVGHTVRRPTVDHTGEGKGERSEGRSLPRTGRRSHGRRSDVQTVSRTVGRTGGRAVPRAGSRADRTPDRAIGTSGTNTDRCVVRVDAKMRYSIWPISVRKPAMLHWVEGTSDFFAVGSKAWQRLGLNCSSFSDGERW